MAKLFACRAKKNDSCTGNVARLFRPDLPGKPNQRRKRFSPLDETARFDGIIGRLSLVVRLFIVGSIVANWGCNASNSIFAAEPQSAQSNGIENRDDLRTRKSGDDWPTFLGPNSDSKSNETGLIVPWPQSGPRVVWHRKLGESYGIGAVMHGRYYQFDSVPDSNIAHLLCMNSETGEQLWKFEYESDYQDLYNYSKGPRCSPVIDNNRVYIYGVEGMLHCVDAFSGKKIWAVNVNEQYGVIQNFFGVGSTPVVHDDLLIAMVGGSPDGDKLIPPGRLNRVSGNGSGLVAFDKMTGQERYKLTDELASYASLKLSEHAGRPWCFAFARGGLVGFHPKTGKVDFEFPWRHSSLESVNASNPVVVGNEVFISETYGVGSALLRFRPGGFEKVWADDGRRRENSMETHWNTAIHHGGYLYGCSGRHSYNGELRCIEWKSGKVMWSKPGLTRTSLLYVDKHFVCLGEDGTMRLLRVNPEKYDVVSEIVFRDPNANVPEGSSGELKDAATRLFKYPAWAAPILSHGLMYVRGRDYVACFEVIK